MQNRNKATQKTKTNTRNTKTPKPSKPKINKNKPPHKSPKNWGKKQAFLTLLELCQTHQKQTTITLKPQKKTNPQNTILPGSKTTHNFSYIFCFFQHTVFAFEKLLFHPCQKHLFQRSGTPVQVFQSRYTYYRYSLSPYVFFMCRRVSRYTLQGLPKLGMTRL